MVVDLLTFKEKLDSLLSIAFQKDESFVNSLKESFEQFINKRANKPAELIAKHIDSTLRTTKGVTSEEVENVLDKCLVLFRFIHGLKILRIMNIY